MNLSPDNSRIKALSCFNLASCYVLIDFWDLAASPDYWIGRLLSSSKTHLGQTEREFLWKSCREFHFIYQVRNCLLSIRRHVKCKMLPFLYDECCLWTYCAWSQIIVITRWRHTARMIVIIMTCGNPRTENKDFVRLAVLYSWTGPSVVQSLIDLCLDDDVFFTVDIACRLLSATVSVHAEIWRISIWRL